MKTLTLITLFSASVAFASDSMIIAPKLWFGRFQYEVTDLCIDGQNIRPNHPYVQECTGDIDSNCNPVTVYLSRPLNYKAEVCTIPYIDSADCPMNGIEIKSFVIPKQYLLEEYSYNASGDYASQSPDRKIEFTVPSCK